MSGIHNTTESTAIAETTYPNRNPSDSNSESPTIIAQNQTEISMNDNDNGNHSRPPTYSYPVPPIDFEIDHFPYCIVWTPIPVLTWILPMVGHMGICMSSGVIRDFAGPYYVSEDNMGFGRPTRYLRLEEKYVAGGRYEWDEAVSKASVLYGTRMHNLFCDNCHSHVATALSYMRYRGRTNWNMVMLAFWMFFCGSYVGVSGAVKTWLPFLILLTICILLGIYF